MRLIRHLSFPLLAALVLAGCVSTIQATSDKHRAEQALYRDSDPQTACLLYDKAARNGDAEAQHELAMMFLTGNGIVKNVDYAREWEERAAAQRYEPAMVNLGLWLVGGLYDSPPDPARGMALLQAAAAEDNAEAHLILGQIYARGTPTVQKNANAAAHHFIAAEENGLVVDPEMKNAYAIQQMDLSPFVRKQKPAIKMPTLITDEVKKGVQRDLKRLGYYRSTIDGVIGKGSIKAIKAFQHDWGLTPTGIIDDDLLTSLRNANDPRNN